MSTFREEDILKNHEENTDKRKLTADETYSGKESDIFYDLQLHNQDFKNDEEMHTWKSKKKHFFILSRAGKPIYSRYGDEMIISEYMGIIQAIISFFHTKGDNLRSFTTKNLTVVVLLEGPLYLVGISRLCESEAQIRAQLNILYAQIVSMLTLDKLLNIFTYKENFDLKRFLGSTEIFLDALSDMIINGEPSVLLNSLQCLKLKKSVRDKISSILIKAKEKKLLYGVIVSNLCLISIIRPKNYPIHSLEELFLLFSMIFNTTAFKDGTEHWIPLCFPKFDPKGFVYCYITFISESTALILISTDKNSFFEMRRMKQNIVNDFNIHGILDIIKFASEISYTTLDTNTPCLYHFIYKSKIDAQFTMPQWRTSKSVFEKQEIMRIYRELHSLTQKKSCNKLQFISTKNYVAISWITPTFEFFTVANPEITKQNLIKNTNAILKWIKKEEYRLFMKSGITF
ncbi:hypothetical protein PORY_002395 [Pneumocystis oryctolagi]|uniref:Uncharacterized protein n=1 Tax=Pneumocystis oryctolagi TaxID=42067 RepID=A0ACB7CBL1_9ASCO|nr:hypothetical protein PORY_002395 [Pneumocystis oryctolagi]